MRIRATVVALLLAAGCATAPVPEPEPAPEPLPAPEPAPRPRRVPPPRKIIRLPFPEILPVPVDGVEIGDLTDSFRDPRSGGRRHEAIDILAPRHTPVRSTVDGWVSRRATNRLGGKTISVIGPGGYRHYYAHLDRWARVGEGDRVRAGDILGFVGNSGNARNGPTHLHYAVYTRGGEAVNPYPLLVRGPGSFD